MALSGKGRGPQRLRREGKLDAILDGAALLFNAEGVGSISLADVAEHVGVSRATLYHYVNDRGDLVFRCHQRACELMSERLAVAAERRDPLDGLLEYFRDSLSDATPAAVVTDLGWMSPDGRSIVDRAIRRNHLALVELVETGIASGRMRPYDPHIVAHALVSIASQIRMARRWVDFSEAPLDIASLVDCIHRGFAIDRDRPFVCGTDVDRFSRLKAATFGPGGLTEMRVEQILMAASRMFNAHGVEGVSIDVIAAELGATRGTIYHYFTDKEDLVRRCADRAHALYEAFIEFADATGADPFEKLTLIGHLNSQAQAGTLQPLAMWIGLDSFAAEERERHRQRLRTLLRRTIALAEEGVASGYRSTLDVRTLAIARAGAFSWIPRWQPPVPDATPFRIADDLTAFMNNGIAV